MIPCECVGPGAFGAGSPYRPDRYGNSSDPSLNGHLQYPNDIDGSLDEATADKIRKYRTDYNNNPPNTVSFMPSIASTSGRLHSEFVRLLFLQTHRETVMWNKLATLQDAHDQENNAPSAPLAK